MIVQPCLDPPVTYFKINAQNNFRFSTRMAGVGWVERSVTHHSADGLRPTPPSNVKLLKND
jgi:hypothetical protein